MNNVNIIGRLTKDVNVRATNSGTSVASFTVAVDRGKDKDGNDRGADFISCIAFGRTADNLERFSGKGLRVAVTGHIQTGSYEKDGGKVYTTDVIADRLEFIDWKHSNGQQEAPSGFMAMDEDVPF